MRHRAQRAEQEGEAAAGPLDIADVQLLGAKKSAFILKQILYGPKLGYWLVEDILQRMIESLG